MSLLCLRVPVHTPPYAEAGKENEELLELESESTSKMTALQKNIHDWKVWMIEFMKKHGFWGLVAMSAWPNAAFDLCGICCGTFMMPFWQGRPRAHALLNVGSNEGFQHRGEKRMTCFFFVGWREMKTTGEGFFF